MKKTLENGYLVVCRSAMIVYGENFKVEVCFTLGQKWKIESWDDKMMQLTRDYVSVELAYKDVNNIFGADQLQRYAGLR